VGVVTNKKKIIAGIISNITYCLTSGGLNQSPQHERTYEKAGEDPV